MKIRIKAFQKVCSEYKQVDGKDIDCEPNKAAAIAGETVELYLRRIDFDIDLLTIEKVI